MIPRTARFRLTFAALLLVAVTLFSAATVVGPLGPSPAQADGDPASDTLLGTDVFYPFEPVSKSAASALNSAVAKMRKLHEPIKVALIPTNVDLGTVTALFGQPQTYANFLAQEISFVGKSPLLVVMPAGYGANGMPPAAVKAVRALPRPTGAGGTALATAALTAVEKISAANGHPLGDVAGAGTSGSGNSTVTVIALVAAAVLGAAAVAAATLRRREGETPHPQS